MSPADIDLPKRARLLEVAQAMFVLGYMADREGTSRDEAMTAFKEGFHGELDILTAIWRVIFSRESGEVGARLDETLAMIDTAMAAVERANG